MNEARILGKFLEFANKFSAAC